MTILHIITHYYPRVYGAENFAKFVAEKQSKNHQVILLTGLWDSDWKRDEIHQGVKIIRTKVVRIRYLQTILAIIPFVYQGIKLINQYKPTIVHTHIYPNMIVGAILKKIFKSTKFIATIQGGDIGDYPEVFGPFEPIAKKLIAWCLNQADAVHCVSNYLVEELTSMGINKEKIHLIPNGVDTTRFKPPKQLVKRNKIKLISTSRLETKNNLKQLIIAVSKLQNKNINTSLDIYGEGSLKDQLQETINSLKMDSYIKLNSYIPHSKLHTLLPNYDFFVRLSTTEGFGISFIEAMSSGLIPIGTRVGGIKDIIEPNINGYLISLDRSISAQLKSIFDKPIFWPKIRHQAIITAKTKFSWRKIFPQVEKLYQSIK